LASCEAARTGVSHGSKFDDGARAERVGEAVALDNAEMDAPFGGLRCGLGDLGVGVRALVEEDARPVAQGGGKEPDGAGQRGDGARSDDGSAVRLQPVLGTVGADLDVGEAEIAGGGFDEARLLLGGFEEREARFGEDEGEGDAGESGAAAGIGHVRGGGEEAPGNHGIGDVLNSGFPRADDACEIEVPVGLHDEIQVASRARDQVIAMRQVRRQDFAQFVGKRHGAFMIASGEGLP
jgi:hypothetical protein